MSEPYVGGSSSPLLGERIGEPGHEPGESHPRFARAWATTLIVVGISLWTLTVVVGALAPYTGPGDRVPPGRLIILYLLAGLIVGAVLGAPLIVSGRLIKLLLEERDETRGVLRQHEGLRHRLELVEYQCECLRQEVGELVAENDGLKEGWREMTEALSKAVSDILERLRSSPLSRK